MMALERFSWGPSLDLLRGFMQWHTPAGTLVNTNIEVIKTQRELNPSYFHNREPLLKGLV